MNIHNLLPEIKVVPLTASNFKPTFTKLRRGRPAKIWTGLADIRLTKTNFMCLVVRLAKVKANFRGVVLLDVLHGRNKMSNYKETASFVG